MEDPCQKSQKQTALHIMKRRFLNPLDFDYPRDFVLQQGGKFRHPRELTGVSDRGNERSQRGCRAKDEG
jgi:hypothetical protein